MLRFLFVLICIFSIGFTSCGDDTEIEDYDIVKTEFSDDFWNDNSPQTYFLIDEIKWIVEEGGNGNSNPSITRSYDEAILSSIKSNMRQLGYTQVTTADISNPPDLVIAAQAVATTFSDVSLVWDSWYDWWGFYDPYYPGGAYPVYYEWTEGTVIIEIGDGKSVDIDQSEIDIVWIAGINGLVRNTQEGNIEFIQNRISNAFEESEDYLKAN